MLSGSPGKQQLPHLLRPDPRPTIPFPGELSHADMSGLNPLVPWGGTLEKSPGMVPLEGSQSSLKKWPSCPGALLLPELGRQEGHKILVLSPQRQ